MEAAIQAGVKRIVPSEFSTNLEAKASQSLPIVKDKLEIRKYVEELGVSGKIEWTSVNNGPFCVGWTVRFIAPNLKDQTATMHDGGNSIVCTSTLERIGESVAKVLIPEYLEATKNKPIYIYSVAVSERKMTDLFTKIMGIKFKEIEVSIESVTKAAYEALEKGDMSKYMTFYIPFCFSPEYHGDFRDMAWNEKLGLPLMTDEELEMARGWIS